ncbi:hypothetical protein LXL04_007517 [Taraxacum kok-saghyz]
MLNCCLINVIVLLIYKSLLAFISAILVSLVWVFITHKLNNVFDTNFTGEKEGHKKMTSSSKCVNIIDVDKYEDAKSDIIDLDKDEAVDDFYMYDEDELLLISAEKYTQISERKASSTPHNSQKDNKLMVRSEGESFCGICMDTKSGSEMFSNPKVCGHLFCLDCIRQHVSVKIQENVAMVKCPDPTCKSLIGPEVCGSIVPKQVLERWEDALCESWILKKFYCPFKDCSAMLVDDSGKVVTSSECPNCNRLFCAQCKVAWHSGLNCREYKKRNPEEDIMLMELAKNEKWQRCPSCNYLVEKRGGCSIIKCRCGHFFCYLCGKTNRSIHKCEAIQALNRRAMRRKRIEEETRRALRLETPRPRVPRVFGFSRLSRSRPKK